MDPDSLPPVTRTLVQSNDMQNGESHLLLKVSAPQISSRNNSESQGKGSSSQQQHLQFSLGFSSSQQSQHSSQKKKEYPPFRWEFKLHSIKSGNPLLQTLFQSLILGLVGIVDTLCAQRHELFEIIHRKDINLLDLSEAYGNSAYKPKRYKAEYKKFQKKEWETKWFSARVSGCDNLVNVFDRAMDSAQPVWGFHAVGKHWTGKLTIVKSESSQLAELDKEKSKDIVQQVSISSNEDDLFCSFGSPFQSFAKALREKKKIPFFDDTQNSCNSKNETRTLKRKRETKKQNVDEDVSETEWSDSDDLSEKRVKTDLSLDKPNQDVEEFKNKDILLPPSSPNCLFPRFSQSQPSDPIDLDNVYNPNSDIGQFDSQPYSIPQWNENYLEDSFVDDTTIEIETTTCTKFNPCNTDTQDSTESSGAPSTPRRSKKSANNSQPFQIESILHSDMMLLHQRLSQSPSPKKPKQDRYADLDITTLSSTKIVLPPSKTLSSKESHKDERSTVAKNTGSKIPQKSVSDPSACFFSCSSASLAENSFPKLVFNSKPQTSLNPSKVDFMRSQDTALHSTDNAENKPSSTTISTPSSLDMLSSTTNKLQKNSSSLHVFTKIAVASNVHPTKTEESKLKKTPIDESISKKSNMTTAIINSQNVSSLLEKEHHKEIEYKRQKLKDDLKKMKKRKVIPKSRF